MLQKAGVFNILTCKRASRHSGVPFFNIGTSKSGPSMWCFAHFDLNMRFAPQPRAISQHRNFKNGSDTVSFLTFSLPNVLRATAACHFSTSELQNGSDTVSFWACSLPNVLRATAACHFSTSELQKWLRHCQFFDICTSKCASCHSRVPFFNIGTSKMAPTMRCFVHFDLQMCLAPQRHAIFHLSARTATSAPAALARLLFEHQEPRIIEKTQRFATPLTFFARVPSF